MPRKLTTELGKRYSLSAKTSLETNLALKAAASASGRSVSQEIERRLEASFHDDDAMRVIRETIRQEMRAEFVGREAARVQALYNAPTQIYQGYSQSPVQGLSGLHGQQWSAAAVNQSAQQWHGCANFDQTANQYSLSAKFSPKKDG